MKYAVINGALNVVELTSRRYLFCPFANASDTSADRKVCGEWCALFEVTSTESSVFGAETQVTLHCGAGTRTFLITDQSKKG